MLPPELLKKVIRHTIGRRGHTSTDLECSLLVPVQVEGGQLSGRALFEDGKALGRVCSLFRRAVAEISAEHVIIAHCRDLEWVVVHFECSIPRHTIHEQTRCLTQSLGGPPVSAGCNLGHWTKRIDLQIVGNYNPTLIPILLNHTPNLLVFVDQARGNTIPPIPGRLPRETLFGLLRFSKNLKCLRLESYGESLTLRDICDISKNLPGLVTLQITHLYGYAMRSLGLMSLGQGQIQSGLTFPHLRTLSIGTTRRMGPASETPPLMVPGWDLILGGLACKADQLPKLERVDLSLIPFSCAGQHFFTVHGSKIRKLLIPTYAFPGHHFTSAINWCSQLETLILVHGRHYPAPEFPIRHSALRRIWLVPATREMDYLSPSGFDDGVTASIDDLLQRLHAVHFPRLRELRIQDVGIWEGAIGTSMMSRWFSSWKEKGVEMLIEGCPLE